MKSGILVQNKYPKFVGDSVFKAWTLEGHSLYRESSLVEKSNLLNSVTWHSAVQHCRLQAEKHSYKPSRLTISMKYARI